MTNEQPQPNCFFSQLLGVHLLERSFLVFFVIHGGEPMQIAARFSVNQKQTRYFLRKGPFSHQLIEHSQSAYIFFPRRGFLLEILMQSESAVGVGLKIYWPYSTSMFANISLRM